MDARATTEKKNENEHEHEHENAARRWPRFAHVFFACLLLATLLPVHALAGGELTRLVVTAIIVVWIAAVDGVEHLRRWVSWRGPVLLGVLVTLAQVESTVMHLLTSAGLLLLLFAARPAGTDERRLVHSLLPVPALLILVWTARERWPAATALLDEFGVGLSRWVAAALGSAPLEFGPTAAGLWVTIVCICFLAARLAFAEWRPIRLAVGSSLLAAGQLAYLAALSSSNVRLTQRAIEVAPAIELAFMATLTAAFVAWTPWRSVRPAPARLGLSFAACGAAWVLTAYVFAASWVTPVSSPRVLIYTANEGPLLNFRKPDYQDYGLYCQGMFGFLPEYLRDDGFGVEFLESIRRDRLSDADVLTVINVTTDWNQADLETIWNWVRDGGRLLVLGDHTDVGGVQVSSIRLLEPFGIRFRFDSAVPSRTAGWRGSYRYFDPVLCALGPGRTPALGIGASLELRGRARPVMTAPFALADAGDRDAADHAFLGDYRYAPGERVGDVTVVAEAPLGRGRCVVFGDTSPFQNSAISESYEALIRPTFAALAGHRSTPLLPEACSMALWFTLVATSVWILRRRPLVLLLLAGGECAAGYGFTSLQAHALSRAPLEQRTAWIDFSHAPRVRFRTGDRLDLSGLILNLERAGFRVRLPAEFDEVAPKSGDAWILIAPAVEYDAAETARLLRHVDDGGLLIAAVGHPHAASIGRLLETVEIEVGDVPVGSIPLSRSPNRARIGVEYVAAWPLRAPTTPAAPTTKEWTVYGAFRDAPLALCRWRGAGGCLVVGDSSFFGSANLEAPGSRSMPNIWLLKTILDDFRDRGVAK